MFKKIKLHRILRKEQEILCDECVKWSQVYYFNSSIGEFPSYKLKRYEEVNRLVSNLEGRLPLIYFIISDIFGLYKSFRVKRSDFNIRKLKMFTYDIVADPGF